MLITICFSCCEAQKDPVPTCTNPLTQANQPDQEKLCPASPKLSISDLTSSTIGRLDSDTVFVDEALLRKAVRMDPDVYIRRVQAGIVVSHRDPPYSTCGCRNSRYFSKEYINPLTACRIVDGAEMYALRENSASYEMLTWLVEECPQYNSSGSGSGSGSGGGVFSGDYLVDGPSANTLQFSSCADDEVGPLGCMGEAFGDRPLGQYYPDQASQITATVFYNNNVRK